MVRALYLQWPGRDQAYEHPSQYTLGRDVLVAPVAEPGASAETEVWFPPGRWVDWFTGERYRGPGTEELKTPLARMPVFMRAGGIVPMQRNLPTTPEGPVDTLVLLAQRGDGKTTVYDDSGRGFAYERGKSTRTTIRQHRSDGATELTIGPARGGFAGQPQRRSYEVRLAGVPRPREVRVDGQQVGTWTYRAGKRVTVVRTGPQPTDQGLRIGIR